MLDRPMRYKRSKLNRCNLFFYGVDYGGPHQIVRVVNRYVITKVDAHKFWSGLGRPWRYAPVTYYLFKIVGDKHLQEITTLQPGVKWREAINYLVDAARNNGELPER